MNVHVEESSFPNWIFIKLRELNINGLLSSNNSKHKFSLVEAGAIAFELAKYDASICTFFMAHNGLGMIVIEEFGNEEQRKRILTPALNFDRILAFGLTEPQNGSDASNILTTATKIEGGWLLNGQKRWIGSGTMGDVIIWARNTSDNNKVQAFIVEKG